MIFLIGVPEKEQSKELDLPDVAYIAAEFSGTGLIYHFKYNDEMNHVHGFDNVLANVLQD